MSCTEIENYEPEDEGWSIVIGPLFTQRPTTPPDEPKPEDATDNPIDTEEQA